MNDLDALKAEFARVSQWRKDNIEGKIGTAEFRRSTLAHRLLTDLIARGGGSAEDRVLAIRELTAIHEGKRDGNTAGK